MSFSLPQLSVATGEVAAVDADTIVVPLFRGGIPAPGTKPVLDALGLTGDLREQGFHGRPGETVMLAAPQLAADRVVVVGLGRLDELTPARLRYAAGAAGRAVATVATKVATTLVDVAPTLPSLRAVAEGFLVGADVDDRFRSTPRTVTLDEVILIVPTQLVASAEETLRRAHVHARAQCQVARLVTTPAGHLGPQDVADWAAENCGDQVELEVWDLDRLEAERCGGMVAVGIGSERPPRMVIARYRPARAIADVALIGKGIVFDTGGLSLKSNDGMSTMKDDMAGAAVVLATMASLADLDCRVNVTAFAALAENSPSGMARVPGDVFTARNGRTVQVLNTDAEGRLVMADALSLAAETSPDAIVDVATLTGAVGHAVGKLATGVFGNDDDLLDSILASAAAAGEDAWHLPLWEHLREDLDSDVADLDNIARAHNGGATIAALFLREFVDDLPWVHLDIAGAAWGTADRGHQRRQGTGAGVRTLLRWLERHAG